MKDIQPCGCRLACGPSPAFVLAIASFLVPAHAPARASSPAFILAITPSHVRVPAPTPAPTRIPVFLASD